MTMRYLLSHRTSYAYPDPVDLAHHLLHLSLPTTDRQIVHAQSLRIEAPDARHHDGKDHFGNAITHIIIEKPHTHFAVTLTAKVDTVPVLPPETANTPSWRALASALDGDGFPDAVDVSEFCHSSPLTPVDAAISRLAATCFGEDRPVLDGALRLMNIIHKDFKYEPGSTDVATTSRDVMKRGAGVCQDFAHLAIAALRSQELAARYVSGYIRTSSASEPSGSAGLIGSDASHAWVSLWCGADIGWLEFDPTNNCRVGEDHVVLAYGRDFADVSPLRGVILGGRAVSPTVEVSLTPLG